MGKAAAPKGVLRGDDAFTFVLDMCLANVAAKKQNDEQYLKLLVQFQWMAKVTQHEPLLSLLGKTEKEGNAQAKRARTIAAGAAGKAASSRDPGGSAAGVDGEGEGPPGRRPQGEHVHVRLSRTTEPPTGRPERPTRTTDRPTDRPADLQCSQHASSFSPHLRTCAVLVAILAKDL